MPCSSVVAVAIDRGFPRHKGDTFGSPIAWSGLAAF
jgi:hypothetical protein